MPVDGMLLGGFAGAQVMLVVLSLLVSAAYGDRVLLLLAAAMAASVATIGLQSFGLGGYVPQALMLVMAIGSLQLRALTSHVGSLRQRSGWTTGAALLIVLIAAADLVLPWRLLPAATAAWIAIATLITLRAWPQSSPWIKWTVPAHLMLVVAALRYGLAANDQGAGGDTVLAGVLAFWAMALYLASVWRSRVLGERRSGEAMAETLNPLTGLSTPVVLHQRIEAARALMRRYGHPSSLLLIHVEHLGIVAQKLGAETAEAAALEAGTRIRDALGAGDVGARLGFQRFAVLAEGTSPKEAAAALAGRVLSAGLRAPLSILPGDYLTFRIVITDLLPEGVAMTELFAQLDERLDADVVRARDKRIRVVAASELQLNTIPGAVPPMVPTQY
jgi:GGDEF domain-containing protein